MNLLKYKNYFIQPTKEGIFIFFIKARNSIAKESIIQYDGHDNALFLRTPTETILLDYINPAVQKDLLNSSFVEIAEIDTDTEEINSSYQALIKKVPFVFVA